MQKWEANRGVLSSVASSTPCATEIVLSFIMSENAVPLCTVVAGFFVGAGVSPVSSVGTGVGIGVGDAVGATVCSTTNSGVAVGCVNIMICLSLSGGEENAVIPRTTAITVRAAMTAALIVVFLFI